jgi:hypothetical protein
LPSKHKGKYKALSSIPSTAKKLKNKKPEP